MDSKGQTALEYLLILVIALAVIVGIMVWMQSSQTAIGQSTINNTVSVTCSLRPCDEDSDCSVANGCPPGATCDLGTLTCKLA